MIAKVFAIFLIGTGPNSGVSEPLKFGSFSTPFQNKEGCQLAADIVNEELTTQRKSLYVVAVCLPVEFKRKEAGE